MARMRAVPSYKRLGRTVGVSPGTWRDPHFPINWLNVKHVRMLERGENSIWTQKESYLSWRHTWTAKTWHEPWVQLFPYEDNGMEEMVFFAVRIQYPGWIRMNQTIELHISSEDFPSFLGVISVSCVGATQEYAQACPLPARQNWAY